VRRQQIINTAAMKFAAAVLSVLVDTALAARWVHFAQNPLDGASAGECTAWCPQSDGPESGWCFNENLPDDGSEKRVCCSSGSANFRIYGDTQPVEGLLCAVNEICCYHLQHRASDRGIRPALSCVAGSQTEQQCKTCAAGYGGVLKGICRCKTKSCRFPLRQQPIGRVPQNSPCIVCGPGPFCPSPDDDGPEDCDSNELGWTLIFLTPVPFLVPTGVVGISIWCHRSWPWAMLQLVSLVPPLVLSLLFIAFPNYWSPRILGPIGCFLLIAGCIDFVLIPRWRNRDASDASETRDAAATSVPMVALDSASGGPSSSGDLDGL
jgi:hypothetical protein